ncbi:MAG: sigma-70 family RNA polymerase sigma factor [Prevotella sp.]
MGNSEFETFFKDNYIKACSLAFSLVRDEEASRDIVSDAFEQMLAVYKTDGTQKCNAGYLFTTIRNRCLNHARKQHAVDKYYQAMIHANANHPWDTATMQEWVDKVEAIMEAMDDLTPKTRQVMMACFIERKKYSETAEDMGISKSTVKKHVMQGLAYLRGRFKEEPT